MIRIILNRKVGYVNVSGGVGKIVAGVLVDGVEVRSEEADLVRQGTMTGVVIDPPESTFDEAEIVESAVDGLVESRCLSKMS